MKNKCIYEMSIKDKNVLDVKMEEDVVRIILDGDEIKLYSSHEQDCCEQVYADFGNFTYSHKYIVGKIFDTFKIKAVEGIGFIVCFEDRYSIGEKVFVPCYNDQNGYYSSSLELMVSTSAGTSMIDISDLTEDVLSLYC